MVIVNEDSFPQGLLKKSIDERLSYFTDYSVAHTVLANAFNRLMQIIHFPAGKQLVFVIGPTGSGKTFLMEGIIDELKYIWSKEQHTDRGRIPVVGIEVPAKDRINNTCADIYYRLLVAMEEPLLDKKIVYGDIALYRDSNNAVNVRPRPTPTIIKYRHALEAAIRHRRPIAILLDEGQHLLSISGLGMDDIMDWQKSLANMTKQLIILFGTYEMYDLLDLSDQLMKRSRIIHLRRYKNEGDDLVYFNSTIDAFQKNMPFSEEPKLLNHSEYLYERSAGCIGNLHDWLLEAYNMALNDNTANTLEFRHLKSSVPLSFKRAMKMHASISKDEDKFYQAIGKDIDDELTDSNYGPQEKKRRRVKERNTAAGQSDNGKSPRKRIRVGERKPGRDKIGRKEKTA